MAVVVATDRGGAKADGARKAISEVRDRMQSRVLVAGVGLLLLWQTAGTMRAAFEQALSAVVELLLTWHTAGTMRVGLPELRGYPGYALGAVLISVLFAVAVRALRAATGAAAAFGGMICLAVTYPTGWLGEPVWRSALTPLATLFLLTFLATRAGRERKARAGLAEKRSGRSASQVIANLSAAALAVSPAAEWMLRRSVTSATPGMAGFANVWVVVAMKTACLAALVEATADTLSSELGQAFGGRPVLLAGFRRVEPGTDGAISLLGTAAGVGGGVLVTTVGVWAMHMDRHAGAVALGCGVAGLFADSVLGATIERKGLVGNDLVNFAATLVAAVLAAALMR